MTGGLWRADGGAQPLRGRCSALVCCSDQTDSSSASCRRTSGETPPSTGAPPHRCCLGAETRTHNQEMETNTSGVGGRSKHEGCVYAHGTSPSSFMSIQPSHQSTQANIEHFSTSHS